MTEEGVKKTVETCTSEQNPTQTPLQPNLSPVSLTKLGPVAFIITFVSKIS